jgi:hypothetical protein
MKSLRSLRTKISGFFADISISKWMQLWLESLFRSRDYLLCVVHLKSSKFKEVFQKNATKIHQQWESRGFSFGIFRDPPGRIWPDFSQSTKEVVTLAEGQIEIEVQGQMYRPAIGEEFFIHAQATHTGRNFGTVPNIWYYGYRVV